MMAAVLLNQIESGLSPPYDGSEMSDLFPDLAGVESAVESDEITLLDSPDNVDMNGNASDDEQLMNYLMEKVSPSENQTMDSSSTSRYESSEDDDPHWVVSVSGKSGRISAGKTCQTRARPISPPVEQEENEPPLNRNALMARLNRQKKKEYLQELETSVKLLKQENKTLKQDKKVLVNEVDKLGIEVRYLKGVIANQSELSSLLQNIGVTGLRLHSSFSHITPSKEQNTSRLKTVQASGQQKESHETDHGLNQQSETESEIKTPENELSLRNTKRRSTIIVDHDYTIPASINQNNAGSSSKVYDETSPPAAKVCKTSHTPMNLRSTNASVPSVTHSIKTIMTNSGQKVKQTVVTLGKPKLPPNAMRRATKENQPLNLGAEKSGEAAGVCLHVSSGSVSLEFCAHCSHRAKAAMATENNLADEVIEVVD